MSVNNVTPHALTREIFRVVRDTNIACHVILMVEPIPKMINFMNNAQRRNPYSNTYNPGRRHHPICRTKISVPICSKSSPTRSWPLGFQGQTG